MSQKRFINFQDPVNSFPLNERYNGILPSGRYRGFDGFSNVSGLTFSVTHTNTGATKTLVDESVVTNVGEWLTQQGTSIHEDAPIAGLSIASNVGLGIQRIDILVGEHLHDVLVAGGLNAEYHIIQGPNNGSIPVPAIADSQTILAYIYVPAGAGDAAGITLVPATVPGNGGEQYAVLNRTNVFNAEQQSQQGPNAAITVQNLNTIDRGIITNFTGGNLYKITDASQRVDFIQSKQKGTLIAFYFKLGALVYDSSAYAADGAASGYLAIKLEGNGALEFLTLPVNTVLLMQVVQQDDNTYWKVLSRSDAVGALEVIIGELSNHESRIEALEANNGKIGRVQLNTLRMFAGDTAGLFDGTGKGIAGTDWENWKLTNGQNLTPDYRQCFLAGLDPTAAGFQVGQSGGSNAYQLSQSQMPVLGIITTLWGLSFPRGNTGSSHRWLTGFGNNGGDGTIEGVTIPLGGSGSFIDNKPKYWAVAIAIFKPDA